MFSVPDEIEHIVGSEATAHERGNSFKVHHFLILTHFKPKKTQISFRRLSSNRGGDVLRTENSIVEVSRSRKRKRNTPQPV